ncbi:hypothetical protein [Chondromyces crocatus]|uniref:Uncharacterized protein n=1 Tax=Chondromyces crocatus TaxID=52 RepID=A0A0K1E8W7_CHOCO|nr:hypothetical protein [Chondromyces crocatus]AKT37023.1 uncharacterized protein CMC5_011490 [Chondromyces crocatus]
MAPRADLAGDVKAYAALAVALASPSANRAAILSAHGLDEAGWEALDDAWQARIAEEDEEDEAGIPRLMAAYADAFVQAQRARAKTVLSFERFIEVARVLQRTDDAPKALARMGLTLADVMASQHHWTARMMEDDALATQFRHAMR